MNLQRIIVLLACCAPAGAFAQCRWDDAFAAQSPNARVISMATFDDGSGESLFVGGNFTSIGGEPRNYIARWDGNVWHDVGGGVSFDVNALTVHDDGTGPALYAGGRFTSAGGNPADRVARWDGQSWSDVGGGTDGEVLALASYDGGSGSRLFAGGRFLNAGGNSASFLGAWDGTSWSDVDGSTDGFVFSLGVVRAGFNSQTNMTDTQLWVGGLFNNAGDQSARNVAAWNGERWFRLNSGLDDIVRAISQFDDGSGLAPHVGGDFRSANVITFGIAKYQFTQFMDVEDGVEGDVNGLATFDDGVGNALYAAGDFREVGDPDEPISANGIARWDGESWSPLGLGVTGGQALTVMPFGSGGDRSLYVGGWFLNAGGMSSPYIARWLCADARIFADGFEETSM